MRQLRFRAWHKEAQVMCRVAQIGFGKEAGKERVRLAGIGSEHRNVWMSKVVLMQSTGLKDKNGVEIFEGDILHTDKHHANGLSINVVVEYEPATGFFGNMPDGSNPSYASVIGNIHENPNLLK